MSQEMIDFVAKVNGTYQETNKEIKDTAQVVFERQEADLLNERVPYKAQQIVLSI